MVAVETVGGRGLWESSVGVKEPQYETLKGLISSVILVVSIYVGLDSDLRRGRIVGPVELVCYEEESRSHRSRHCTHQPPNNDTCAV